ncbi:hypothetical protein [Streptomyces bambusae]|uniref:hypothetical protein n=1 Tax=Streptomyces bambusae TaxID=1550616 RepID=UPI0021553AFC|nr:hypothetical protein [Streptomyces bambusae]
MAASATNAGDALAPSPVVDEGWHAAILHTEVYAGLCGRLGRFVHHFPQRPEDGEYRPDIIEHTLDTMRAAGFEPDLDLWRGPAESLIEVAAQTWHSPSCGIKPMPTPQCLSDPQGPPAPKTPAHPA